MSELRMPDLNKVLIAGRLTRDPDLKYVTSGDPLTKLGLATSKKYKSKTGEMKEETVFYNVTIWGKSAEWLAENLKSGAAVMIEGSLTSNEWEDKETGQKRSAVEVKAQRVQPMAWDEDKR